MAQVDYKLEICNRALSFCSRGVINSMLEVDSTPLGDVVNRNYELARLSCLATRHWNFATKRAMMPFVIPSWGKRTGYRYVNTPADFVAIVDIERGEKYEGLYEQSQDADYRVISGVIEIPSSTHSITYVNATTNTAELLVSYVSSDDSIKYPPLFTLFLSYKLAVIIAPAVKEGLADVGALMQLANEAFMEAIRHDSCQEAGGSIGGRSYLNVRL